MSDHRFILDLTPFEQQLAKELLEWRTGFAPIQVDTSLDAHQCFFLAETCRNHWQAMLEDEGPKDAYQALEKRCMDAWRKEVVLTSAEEALEAGGRG